MKKLVIFLLTFILIAFAFSGCKGEEYVYGEALKYPQEGSFVATGTEGRFTYVLYEDYAKIINMDVEDSPTSVTIPEELEGKPVKVISGGIATGNVTITTLVIPDSVEVIGNFAFNGCAQLENVTMSRNLKKAGCGVLGETPWFNALDDEFVVIGKGVLIKYNGDGGNIQLPENVGYISDAFTENIQITTIKIPDTVKGICDSAFYKCGSLSDVELPEGLCDIGAEAFKGTTWVSMIEEDFVVVGDGVLIDYRGDDTEVTIPENVKYVAGAFYDNQNITSVTVPESVKYVRSGTFYNCINLSKVDFKGADTVLDSSLFRDCISLCSVELPKNLEVINDYLFYGCSKLLRVDIPDTVKYIGAMSFYYCIVMTEVEVPDGVLEIGSGAFFGCTILRKVHLPDSIAKLGGAAFSCCYELQPFELPPKVTVIEGGLFSYCLLFTDVKIPERITKVGDYAFEAIKDIELEVEGFATVLGVNVFGEEPKNPKIICLEGSVAEKYAIKNEINYTLK